MTWNAVIIGGSALISGWMSSNAADDAGDKQKKWRQRAIDEERRQYDLTREDYRPMRELGYGAVDRMGRASTGDMSDFNVSPGYNWRMEEGTRNLGNKYSGKSGGGNAMRALAEWSQNFASNEFGNWWNRQAGMAGLGQSATTGTAAAGAGTASRIGSHLAGIGDNYGSIGLWDAANQNNAMQSGLSNYLYMNPGAGFNPASNNYSTGQNWYDDAWGPPAPPSNSYPGPR